MWSRVYRRYAGVWRGERWPKDWREGDIVPITEKGN